MIKFLWGVLLASDVANYTTMPNTESWWLYAVMFWTSFVAICVLGLRKWFREVR